MFSVPTMRSAKPPKFRRSFRSMRISENYAVKTFVAGGNRQKFTLSLWVRLELPNNAGVFGALIGTAINPGASEDYIRISGDGIVGIFDGANGFFCASAAGKVPYMEWTHVHLTIDTTQPNQADRAYWTINGVRDPGTNNYPQNWGLYLNNAAAHYLYRLGTIGGFAFNGLGYQFAWVDNLTVPASAFGSAASNGKWLPKGNDDIKTAIAGGGPTTFFQTYEDGSTADALFIDYSGKGNNFTTAAVNVQSYRTAVSADSPWFPYSANSRNRSGSVSYNYGGYGILNPTNVVWLDVGLTLKKNSGKWYSEMVGFGNGGYTMMGFAVARTLVDANFPGDTTNSGSVSVVNTNQYTAYFESIGYLQPDFAVNNLSIGRMAIDIDAGKVWFGCDTTPWFGGGDPAAGTLPTFSFTPGLEYQWEVAAVENEHCLNPGALFTNPESQYWEDANGVFKYQPPAGFKALVSDASAPLPPAPIFTGGNVDFWGCAFTINFSETVTGSVAGLQWRRNGGAWNDQRNVGRGYCTANNAVFWGVALGGETIEVQYIGGSLVGPGGVPVAPFGPVAITNNTSPTISWRASCFVIAQNGYIGCVSSQIPSGQWVAHAGSPPTAFYYYPFSNFTIVENPDGNDNIVAYMQSAWGGNFYYDEDNNGYAVVGDVFNMSPFQVGEWMEFSAYRT